MINSNAAVADAEAASFTRAKKSNVPTAVGVPEIVPPPESERPFGSEPALIDQE
jgi:hypothetical protein